MDDCTIAIQYNTCWDHVKVTWPEVNHWPCRDEVIIYIFRCVLISGARWYCYFCSSTFSSKVFGGKSPLSSSATILTFRHMWHINSPKNDLSKNCRSRLPVSNAFYCLSLACFVFEISGGGGLSPVGTKWAQTPVDARASLVVLCVPTRVFILICQLFMLRSCMYRRR